MKPRKNYRTRPKKSGAKKKQKVLSQVRKLTAVGYEREKLGKMTTVQIRELLKKSGKKKAVRSKPAKKKVEAKSSKK